MSNKPSTSKHRPLGLEILYEDRDILVIDKSAGLLTMGTDSEKTRTAYWRLTEYVRKGYVKSRNRVFIVHRLDREVSGLLIFAKTDTAKRALQEQWENVDKSYLAVVHGKLSEKEGVIASYLAEDRAYTAYSTGDANKGKLSRTAYRVLKETKDFSLLEIRLLTGRKHQIRAHLAEAGTPIVGDKKYGGKDHIHKRLALHAHSLTFNHPYNGERMTFQTRVPSYFNKLIGGLPSEEGQPETPQQSKTAPPAKTVKWPAHTRKAPRSGSRRGPKPGFKKAPKE